MTTTRNAVLQKRQMITNKYCISAQMLPTSQTRVSLGSHGAY